MGVIFLGFPVLRPPVGCTEATHDELRKVWGVCVCVSSHVGEKVGGE
jgi:hypothetical protein